MPDDEDRLFGATGAELWGSFKAGFLSAAVSKTAVAPLDRVKLVLQTQACNYNIQSGEVERFAGAGSCLSRMAREQGVASLWRGHQAELLRYAPMHGFNFFFRDAFRLLSPALPPNPHPAWRAGVDFVEGGLAGVASLALLHPFDVLRTRLAADMGAGMGYTRQYSGIVDCFAKTLKLGGAINGFYAGTWISVPGIFVYRGVYLGGHSTAIEALRPEGYLARFAVAQAVTMLAVLAAYPLDTVRRRVMLQVGSRTRMYGNARDCIRRMLLDEGPKKFFSGSGVAMLRSTGAALVLFGYDLLTD